MLKQKSGHMLIFTLMVGWGDNSSCERAMKASWTRSKVPDDLRTSLVLIPEWPDLTRFSFLHFSALLESFITQGYDFM